MQSRRSFVKMVLVGSAAAASMGVLLPRRLKRNEAEADFSALFGDLKVGSKIDRWTIVRIAGVRAGCIPVTMASADGSRFQVDIAQRDPMGPKPVAETATLGLYLVNGGGGTTSTLEDHGLGVMALASALRKREAQGAVAPQLLKLCERRTRYPGLAV